MTDAKVIEVDLPIATPGTLPSNAFAGLLYRNGASLRQCVRGAQYINQFPAGDITVRTWVAADGTVQAVRIVEDTTTTPALAHCIARCMTTWKAPRPSAANAMQDVVINVPRTTSKGPLGRLECAMHRALKNHWKPLSRCLTQEGEPPRGDVVFAVRFDGTGRAIGVRPVGDTMGAHSVTACIAEGLERLGMQNDSGHDVFGLFLFGYRGGNRLFMGLLQDPDLDSIAWPYRR